MARAGDVLENPATGERLVFLRTAADGAGEVLEYELEFVPRGFAARNHLHPRQEERHEVLEGSLGIVVGGRKRRLGPGDVEVVPAGTPHRLFATQEGPSKARFASRPALESEVLLETLFGLARDGKANRRGLPGLLQLAVTANAYRDVMVVTSPAPAVQRPLFLLLAAIGHTTGLKAAYPEYLTSDEVVEPSPEALALLTDDGRLKPFDPD